MSAKKFFLISRITCFFFLLQLASPEEEFKAQVLSGANTKNSACNSTHNIEIFYGQDDQACVRNLEQICRRFPLWLGHMRADCIAHTQWNPQRLSWWTPYNEEKVEESILGGTKKTMEDCMEREFLEYMKSWPNCDEEENNDDAICFPPPTELTSYYKHQNEGDVVIIEWALSPQEAFVVQSLGRCIRKLFPTELFFEKRAFADAADSSYMTSGNICTFMAGFLQLFAPGVEAQVMKIARVAWEATSWGSEEGLPLPDPKTLRIRTSEHLLYQADSKLGLHVDSGSTYTVLISLSDPEDYQGGEFRLESANVKFKPEKLTALVFRSQTTLHAVEAVISGRRETFATELWSNADVPLGQNRPSWSDFNDFISNRSWAIQYAKS